MEASTTITVASGTSTFSLPDDFKAELNPEMSNQDVSGYVRMQKIVKDGINARDLTDSGRPIGYRIIGGQGVFDIEADDDYTFLMDYYRYFEDLDDDDDKAATDLNFQKFLNKCHEAIEYYAMARSKERLNNIQEALYWQHESPLGRFERKALALILEDEQIALANAQLVMEYPG